MTMKSVLHLMRRPVNVGVTVYVPIERLRRVATFHASLDLTVELAIVVKQAIYEAYSYCS